ncbi:MAG: isopeptide-forming domain-containing fimbrial protein [Coriobacteriia bacterium]|nr:isopeptide-forming domain-containing fimbrial protein [Coriobacteriia bacterium]
MAAKKRKTTSQRSFKISLLVVLLTVALVLAMPLTAFSEEGGGATPEKTGSSSIIAFGSGAASLHINGGTGLTFSFVFLTSGGSQQTINIPGNGTVTAVYPNGSALAAGDQLLYVLVSDSNGNPIGTILQNAIGHKSDAGAVLQADGSMGSNGNMVGNTGTINFWFNGFPTGGGTPPSPPSIPSSYLMANKVWLNADGTPDTNPPSGFTFVLNGTIPGGGTVSNIAVLPGVPILVQDGTYTISEPDIPGFTLTSVVSSTMQPNLADRSASATTSNGNYSATFTNQITPINYLFTIDGLKVGNGAPLSPGLFNFTVTDNATGLVVATATNTAEAYISSTSTAYGYITFTPITYTAADVGTHTYTVSEVGTNSPLWTYDSTTQWTVQVTVSMAPDGTISVTNDLYPNIEFHNYYNAVASFQPQATKTVSAGAHLAAGQFNFAVEDNATGLIVSTGTNDASGNINFAHLTFNSNQTGVHTYTIYETTPNSTGWYTDAHRYTLVVDVEPDPSSATGYSITSYYQDSGGNTIPSINFNNVYYPRAFFSLSAFKQTNGGPPLTYGQFQFAVLDEGGNVVATGTNAADGTVTFSYIDYYLSDVGFHQYWIVETTPSTGSWTTSTVEYPVLVYVGDNSNGTMQVTPFVLNTSSYIFINTYSSFGSVDLTATKTVRGSTLADGQFSFAVQDANGVIVATATNDAAGNIVFPEIHYTDADVGTHVYTILETSPGGNGWSISPVVFSVTVEVVDNGNGTVTATPTYDGGGPPTFVNTYGSVGSLALDAEKVAIGGTLTAGQFSFAVQEGGITVATATNDADGYILFPAIQYDSTDVGTHNYTIIETSPSGGGWVTDTTVFLVTVVVVDNGDGTITATPDYLPGEIEFTNTYSAYGSETLTATKVARGEPLPAEPFTFEVLDQGGATVATGSNDASGNITFTPIDFTNLDVGLHRYVIVETGGGPGSGWTLSTSQIAVWITVDDNGDGTLTITTVYPTGAATFTNTYNAAGELVLEATKQGINSPLTADQFHFAVLDDSGTIVATGTNDAAGTISFSPIHYLLNDAGISHYYTIVETDPGGLGWTTDSTVFNVSVDVVDNGNGTITATPTYPGGGVEFTNVYSAEGQVILTATKSALGASISAGQFTFAVLDSGGTTVATGTNDATGLISFSPIDYSIQEVKTHNYTVVETSAAGGGWLPDPTIFTVTVVVTDNGDGTLTATPSYPAGSIGFINTYYATGSLTLTATKRAIGGTLSDNQFDFAVVDQFGVTVATGTNDAAGNVTFTPINYTNSNLGLHRYLMEETSASGSGWTTSTNLIAVWVSVVDNGDGTLSATPMFPTGPAVFTNTYEATGSLALTATKVARGEPLPATPFTFAVLDQSGATVATGSNDAAGNVTFTPIVYSNLDVGLQRYMITETGGGPGSGWSLSTSQIPVWVTVVDNGDGTLTMTPNFPIGAANFINTYNAAGSVTLAATKVAVGNTLTDGQFHFAVLDDLGTIVATGTNNAAGSITFSPIHYLVADIGTHNYTIIETDFSGGGWTTDASIFDISVTVVDNGNGTITATPSYPLPGVEFVNTYYPMMHLAVTKTVNEPSVFLGETVTWSVVANVPNGIAKCTEFAVQDVLEPDLQFVSGSLRVMGLLNDTDTSGPLIPENPNFTLTEPSGSNNNTLTVEFSSPDGLNTLANFSSVLLAFDTIVTPNILNHPEYTLENTVTVNVINNLGQPDEVEPTVIPTVHTAAILINKLDSTTQTGENVNGAAFKIASSALNAGAGNYLRIAADGSILDVGDPGYASATDWVATTAGGTATTPATALFAGLKDFSQDPSGARTYLSYWLVETTAPSGYNLPGVSIRVDFNANNSTAANSYTVAVSIFNTLASPGPGPDPTPGPGGGGTGGLPSVGDNKSLLLLTLALSASALGALSILAWRNRRCMSSCHSERSA